MEDVPYGRILREGWILILIATLIGAAAAYGITRVVPRTYEATTTLSMHVDSTQTSLFERNQFSQARIKSYPALVDSPTVVEGVREDLGLNSAVYSDREIRAMLSATNATDTVLLDVSAHAPTAQMAADVANSAATRVSELVQETENTESDTSYDITLVQALPALPPASPISPQVLPITGLGGIVGLVAGSLTALFRTTTQRRLITIADIRRSSGLPTIGRIPRPAPRFWRAGRRARESRNAAYAETVSNVMALAGSQRRAFVLVPAVPESIGADDLIGLVEAYRRAGRRARIFDTRPNRHPAGEFRSLEELIHDVHVAGAGGAASAGGVKSADTKGAEPGGGAVGYSIYASSQISPAVLESALPELVDRYASRREVVLVVVDPSASSVLAALRAPLIIGVRSRATSIADLLTVTIRCQVMGIRPLGVLLTGARGRLRTAVSLSWHESDRLDSSGESSSSLTSERA